MLFKPSWATEHPTTFHKPLDEKAWILECKVWKETHVSYPLPLLVKCGRESFNDLPQHHGWLIAKQLLTRPTSFPDPLPNLHSLLQLQPQPERGLEIEEMWAVLLTKLIRRYSLLQGSVRELCTKQAFRKRRKLITSLYNTLVTLLVPWGCWKYNLCLIAWIQKALEIHMSKGTSFI